MRKPAKPVYPPPPRKKRPEDDAREFFRDIVNTVREPLLVLDADLRVVMANQSFKNVFNLSSGDPINSFLYDLGNGQWNIPRLRELLEEVLPKRKVVTDYRMDADFASMGRKSLLLNARTLMETDGRRPMILLALEDVTERNRAEAALIKTEKLAASGRLASTLAHEINNPLQAVVNLVDLLRESPGLNEQERAYATMAGEELLRVSRLTKHSLGFYRESTSPEPVSLEEALGSILDLYSKRTNGKKIEVKRQFGPRGPVVNTYPGEVRQVFSTLLVNAMEAVPPGGRITVRAHRGAGGRNLSLHGARVLIADSGPGIPARNLARIFEPFFTTKGEQGNGLGLWVAHAIIDRLGGSIRVRSSVREGGSWTCFSVFLPERLP